MGNVGEKFLRFHRRLLWFSAVATVFLFLAWPGTHLYSALGVAARVLGFGALVLNGIGAGFGVVLVALLLFLGLPRESVSEAWRYSSLVFGLAWLCFIAVRVRSR